MRRILLLLVFCCSLSLSFAQDTKQRFANLGNFQLENGQVIQDCRLGYRTFGKLNAEQSNAILVPTWFTGTSQQKSFVAYAGSIADSTRFFVIVVDALGNGVSSSPSNSKTQAVANFPQFSIRDMVNAEFLLATKHLNLRHLYAVMGISMGGMQSFQWAVSFPDFMDKVVPIIGSPKQSSYDKLFWNAQLNILERNGYTTDAMKSVAALHAMNLYTPEYHQKNTKPEDYQGFISKQEADSQNQNPYNWASQLRAMINHDIFVGKPMEQVAKTLKAKLLVVVATQDHMVNPASAIAFAKAAGALYLELTGECGHMATSCEGQKMTEAIRKFLIE